MRYMHFTLGVVVTAFMLVGTSLFQPAFAKDYLLKYSDTGPPRGPRAESMKWWANAIEKDTNGQVKIKFFWSQSLVKSKETLKAIGSGLTELGSIVGTYTPADLPVWQVASVPFGAQDPWVGMQVWTEMHKTVPELKAETGRKGVHVLMNFTTGPVELLSRGKPILSISDLQGLKIRTTGGWAKLMKSLGATPVSIGFGEVYQALERGTVDAVTNFTPYIKTYKHFEVADHLTVAGMGQILTFGVGINLKLWDDMPEDLQNIISARSLEMIDQFAERYISASEVAAKDMTAGINGKKLEIHALDPAERAKWADAAEPFVDEWKAKIAKKGIDGDRIYADFLKIRDRWENELATKGYPWKR